MTRTRMWTVGVGAAPARIASYSGHLEKDLEDWIRNDPSMLIDGLQWVRRQGVFSADQSRLDLLGLLRPSTWVVAELKAGVVDPATLTQALGYALNVGTMSRAELERFVDPALALDADTLGAALGEEQTSRQVQLVLVGTSQSPRLRPAIEFLQTNGLTVPITVVTFELFREGDGPIFMTRSVEDVAPEEQTATNPTSRSIDTVLDLAREYGVGPEVDAVRAWASESGHRMRVWSTSFAITYSKFRTKTMIYAAPLPGKVRLGYEPALLADELGLAEEAVVAALGEIYTVREPAAVRSFVEGIRKLYAAAGRPAAAPPVT